MDIKARAGRHLMIGIHGTSVTAAIMKQFQATHARGLILFSHNFESPKQIRKLISDLRKKLARTLLVAVDQEGGRVIRFHKGVTRFPDALSLGTKKDLNAMRLQGEIEARELTAMGIDMNLAPVVDVLGESPKPGIGDRSYGKDPEWVSRLSVARILGMQQKGLKACAKHFPGLGSATLDPHFELPQISQELAQFNKVHFPPFRAAIRAGVAAVMSTHVLCPKLDSDKKAPATFSKKIITGLLRKKFRFSGLILTDDLEMGALRRFGNTGSAAVKAVLAGHDYVLICQDYDRQAEAFSALLNLYRKKNL